jgi:membrane-bound serine protease (ClpP class)
VLAIFILIIGLLLVFLEFFVPGAVLGTIGSLLIITSIILFALATAAVWAVVLFVIAIIVALICVIRFALYKIRTTKGSSSIYSNGDQAGYAAVEYPRDQVGKKGVALSDLKPAGHVLIEGQKWQAMSTGGYIEKGCEIEVVGGEGAHLTVKQVL